MVYNAEFAVGLPSPGAAVTPGLVNTGTSAQNALVSLGTVSTPGGNQVEVSFSGTMQQVILGDLSIGEFGAGISVTDTSGNPIPGVDQYPVVSGLGTSTLSLSFSGAQTTSGNLPSGTYKLNFVGNGLVGNGRAVDVSGNGSTGVDTTAGVEFTITAASSSSADFDGDGDVDGRDFLAWQRGFGTPAAGRADGDADNDADVDSADLSIWQGQYGTGSVVAAMTAAPELSEESAEQEATFTLVGNTWVSLPGVLTPQVAEAVFAESSFETVRPAAARGSFASATRSDWSEPLSVEEEAEELQAADEVFADWESVLSLV